MKYKKHIYSVRGGFLPEASVCLLAAVLLWVLFSVILGPFPHGSALAVGPGDAPASGQIGTAQPTENVGERKLTTEERVNQVEKSQRDMKWAVERAEERSLDIKLMSRELIRYVKLMVVVLIAIAVGFPLTMWLVSKKRLLGLSGLSQEVSATLLLVEERQAKLANILKEVQGEIDYLHSMSVPDLKKLIQQAESYLKQNEADLQKTTARKPPRQ